MESMYMPYYSTSPYYDVFARNNDEARDMVYMRKMYPQAMREIQGVVDDECDKMEYDGSLMFDEYPDRLMLERLHRHICERVGDECNSMAQCKDKEMVNDTISVMLCNEMCRRRNRRRRCCY